MQTWPLAVAGSLLLHVTVITGVYLAPSESAALAREGLSRGVGPGPTVDTVPIYLIPDELPDDVARRLEAERAAQQARGEPREVTPRPDQKPVAARPEPEVDPIKIKLGEVNGPKINVETWLKNDAKGEHQAELSKVEQPQLDQNAQPMTQGVPGQDGKDGMNGSPSATLTPTLEKINDLLPKPFETPAALEKPAAAASAPVAPTLAVDPVEAVKAQPAQPKTDLPEGPVKPEIKAGNSGGQTPARVQEATAPKAQEAKEAVEARPAVEAKPGSPGATTSAQPAAANAPNLKPGAPGAPGSPLSSPKVAADRDADASSIRRAAVFRNGRVEAGEGLDIMTRRPEFSLRTQALRQPSSPTLEIVFSKDGRVKSVRVLKSSGLPEEVDRPVVSALYNWRAKGKALDELTGNGVVSLEITIILQ